MFAIIVIIAVFILAGNGAKKRRRPRKYVWTSSLQGDDTFISTLRSYIEEKAKEYERTEGIKVTLDILDAKATRIPRTTRWTGCWS